MGDVRSKSAMHVTTEAASPAELATALQTGLVTACTTIVGFTMPVPRSAAPIAPRSAAILIVLAIKGAFDGEIDVAQAGKTYSVG